MSQTGGRWRPYDSSKTGALVRRVLHDCEESNSAAFLVAQVRVPASIGTDGTAGAWMTTTPHPPFHVKRPASVTRGCYSMLPLNGPR